MIQSKHILAMVGFLLISGTVMAQKYSDKKVSQPSYQNNTLGGGFKNFFKRMELEFGGSAITTKYTEWETIVDRADNNYKNVPVSIVKGKAPLLHGSLNFYLPLNQPTIHSVYGIGFNLMVENTTFYLDGVRPTNFTIPVYFYSKQGADASFDSRTKWTWGWGLGYALSQFSLDNSQSTLVNYPIAYLEGGIFSSSCIKLRLSSNFGYKYRYDEKVPADPNRPYYTYKTSQYQIFPFRLSFIWTPGSIWWERNNWKK